jgi:hypothetical protein
VLKWQSQKSDKHYSLSLFLLLLFIY